MNDSKGFSYTDPDDQELYTRFVELHAQHRQNPQAIVTEVMTYLLSQFQAPRDEHIAFEICSRFIAENERVIIYGGGLHTTHLLQNLSADVKRRIVSIVDRNPGTVCGFGDINVIRPADISTITFDKIIVAHPSRELDMIADLKAIGIPANQLMSVYNHPLYTERAEQKYAQIIRLEISKNSPEHVLVDTTGMTWQLIDDQTLTDILPINKTIKLFLGRPEHMPPMGPYPIVDMRQSAAMLIDALRTIQPKTVYLRTTVQLNTDAYAVLIKETVPNAHLIHEFYDPAVVFSGDYMCKGWGFTDTTFNLAQKADVYSFCNSDTIIYKNGSALWEPFLKYAQGKYSKYYPLIAPRLKAHTPPTAPTDGPLRIIYAGSVHQSGAFEGDSAFAWANVTPFFDRIVIEADIEVTIYNNLHRTHDGDSLYADFLERYSDAPITYHRGVALETLLEECTHHHYGWTAFYRPLGSKLPLIDKVTTHNKMTSYILAGVPVIVTDYFTHVAGLVEKFNAGIVVRSEDIAGLGKRLNWSSYQKHKAGALELRAYMLEHNEQILKTL